MAGNKQDSGTAASQGGQELAARGQELAAREQELAAREQELGSDNALLIPFIEALADLYFAAGLYARAEQLYRRSLEAAKKQADNKPSLIAERQIRLSVTCFLQAKLEEAEALCRSSLDLLEKETGADNSCLSAGLNYLALLLAEKNELLPAAELLVRSAEICRKGEPQGIARLVLTELALSVIYLAAGKEAEALQASQKAEALLKEDAFRSEKSEVAALAGLVQLYYGQGRLSEARILLQESFLSPVEQFFPGHQLSARALHNRAELFRAQGLFAEAEAAFKRALALRVLSLGESDPQVAATAMALAGMYLSQERYADAEPVLKQALKARVRAFGVEHPSVAASVESYATLLKRTKRAALAGKLDSRAREIRSRLVLSRDSAR